MSAEDRRRIEGYRSHSATFRMNVALSELPQFTSMAGRGDAHFAGAIEVSPSLAYIEQAYLDAKQLGWAQRPVISMQVPTTQDDSLAPEGAHVASLFCQHFQRHLPNGQNWDDVREKSLIRSLTPSTRTRPTLKRQCWASDQDAARYRA